MQRHIPYHIQAHIITCFELAIAFMWSKMMVKKLSIMVINLQAIITGHERERHCIILSYSTLWSLLANYNDLSSGIIIYN